MQLAVAPDAVSIVIKPVNVPVLVMVMWLLASAPTVNDSSRPSSRAKRD